MNVLVPTVTVSEVTDEVASIASEIAIETIAGSTAGVETEEDDVTTGGVTEDPPENMSPEIPMTDD
jgi:hypothetical protein